MKTVDRFFNSLPDIYDKCRLLSHLLINFGNLYNEREGSGSVVECLSQASPVSLCCVLEQDKLILA